ncbi:hypothetical protein ACFYST_28155 [Kitasatospora sp. NPDC004614]|uniref:hypothetical protein n=1 Tax=unclassified Kitasatospora TaxID=2633591 RepID=UPI00369F41A8
MEQQHEQQGRQEQDEQHDPRRHAWVPAQRAERRAALVARIRAANAETLERLADL